MVAGGHPSAHSPCALPGSGIRDIRAISGVSFALIYKIIGGLRYGHEPLRDFYDVLEVDEFWTYVGKKDRKVWLIYAYHRESGG